MFISRHYYWKIYATLLNGERERKRRKTRKMKGEKKQKRRNGGARKVCPIKSKTLEYKQPTKGGGGGGKNTSKRKEISY